MKIKKSFITFITIRTKDIIKNINHSLKLKFLHFLFTKMIKSAKKRFVCIILFLLCKNPRTNVISCSLLLGWRGGERRGGKGVKTKRRRGEVKRKGGIHRRNLWAMG